MFHRFLLQFYDNNVESLLYAKFFENRWEILAKCYQIETQSFLTIDSFAVGKCQSNTIDEQNLKKKLSFESHGDLFYSGVDGQTAVLETRRLRWCRQDYHSTIIHLAASYLCVHTEVFSMLLAIKSWLTPYSHLQYRKP